MHKLTRMAAMLVLLAVAAMLPGAQAMEIPQLPSPHPAGCHGHSRVPANPFPAPVSYQCCVTGHAVALPSASFSLRHAAAQFGKFDSDGPRLEFVSCLHDAQCVVPSMSPPDSAPLRI